MEALLAAHGSGAVNHSLQHRVDGGHETIVNIDIGGGTSKIALVQGGRVTETCAMNVGSRLFAWDGDGMLNRVEEAGARVAASLGILTAVGQKLGLAERETLAEKLELLAEYAHRMPRGHDGEVFLEMVQVELLNFR
jgi:ethanolamine utilization protein EutA